MGHRRVPLTAHAFSKPLMATGNYGRPGGLSPGPGAVGGVLQAPADGKGGEDHVEVGFDGSRGWWEAGRARRRSDLVAPVASSASSSLSHAGPHRETTGHLSAPISPSGTR